MDALMTYRYRKFKNKYRKLTASDSGSIFGSRVHIVNAD